MTRTLHAKWSPITYSITYDVDGGNLPGSTQNPFIKTYATPVNLVTPSKTGYVFAGWYSDSTRKTTYDGTTDISTTQVIIKQFMLNGRQINIQ